MATASTLSSTASPPPHSNPILPLRINLSPVEGVSGIIVYSSTHSTHASSFGSYLPTIPSSTTSQQNLSQRTQRRRLKTAIFREIRDETMKKAEFWKEKESLTWGLKRKRQRVRFSLMKKTVQLRKYRRKLKDIEEEVEAIFDNFVFSEESAGKKKAPWRRVEYAYPAGVYMFPEQRCTEVEEAQQKISETERKKVLERKKRNHDLLSSYFSHQHTAPLRSRTEPKSLDKRKKVNTSKQQKRQVKRAPQKRNATKPIDVSSFSANSPSLPLKMGSTLTLISLGEVLLDKSYCNTAYKHIFPVGYKIERLFYDVEDPSQRCVYTNEITSSPSGPIFILSSEDRKHVYKSGTPSGCWLSLLRDLNTVRQRLGMKPGATLLSGPEMLGLKRPIVKQLLEKLSKNYSEVCRRFLGRIG